jgi:inosose dehydratase
MIQIANAPCSWGALEFDLSHKPMGYKEVLDEMSESGYAGTELGDWGFMPTNPSQLKKVLDQKNLALLGAFVPIALADPEAHKEGIDRARKTAKLMFDAGFPNAFIVLADNNGSVRERTRNAGRISPDMQLSRSQWKIFCGGAEMVAETILKEFDMRTVFHHHCAGYVETPGELDMLMEHTNPELLGLCLDMGHYRFGGGIPEEALLKYYDRIWHIHFKDYDPLVGEVARKQGWDYFKSVEKGVFCELGKGDVHFKRIVEILNERKYAGWIVVEQDVLPGMGAPKSSAIHNRQFIRKLGF